MKTIWFHMQGYRDLPDDFRDRYDSIWVTPPNDELCHSPEVAKYLHWNLDELEMADDLGFDGLGLNEHHQNGYGFPISPNMIATVLARRKSNAALVILGNTLPLYNPPIRVAEEFALLDCLSGGRLVAGFPVGSPMDTTGCYGIPPTQVRPRYHEAHDLIKQAWTRPGPFAFNGRFNKLRYVNPWPKPLQKPHPPIWLAGGGSVETWKFATDNDYTYSYLSFMGHKYAKVLMDGSAQLLFKVALCRPAFWQRARLHDQAQLRISVEPSRRQRVQLRLQAARSDLEAARSRFADGNRRKPCDCGRTNRRSSSQYPRRPSHGHPADSIDGSRADCI